MAYFAQIDEHNNVLDVIAINNDAIDNEPFPESEPLGQTFIASLGISGLWLQTSFNGNFRGRFAGIGFVFEANLGEYGEFVDLTPIPPNPPSA
jgi:hypothetical protein